MDGELKNERSAVPWWAAFGAPLVGIPILVALLAVGAAGKADAAVGNGSEKVTTTVRCDAQDVRTELPPVTFEGGDENRS